MAKKKTTAEKKAGKFKINWVLWRFLAMIPLTLLWCAFTFVFAGYSFSALVCLCLIGVLMFYNLADLLKNKFPKPVRIIRGIFTLCLCIGLLVVGVTEAIIIEASFGDPGVNCEYIVVLGAKVREDGPSVSLQNRIDGAYAYLMAHPDAVAVVSGGQGADEPMSEAQCMYDNLTAMGISPERIWMEDKATNTRENIRFSLDLIEEKTGRRPEQIGLVSSEYHLYRAGLLSRAENVTSYGIPARTSWVTLRINYYLREIVAVWYYTLLGGL